MNANIQKWFEEHGGEDGYFSYDAQRDDRVEWIDTIILDTLRWDNVVLDVFEWNETADVFGVQYFVGATEYQEGREPNAKVVRVKEVRSWAIA